METKFSRNIKIVYFVSEDWFFCSHFIDRAKAAKAAGYNIVVICNTDKHVLNIESFGFKVIPLAFNRSSLNPIEALIVIFKLIKIFYVEKPDLLHQVALKPILLGAIAAKVVGINKIINAVVGCGYIYISSSLHMRFIRFLVNLAFRVLLNSPTNLIIFENSDDMNEFINNRLVRKENVRLIRGAGVDINLFDQRKEISGSPVLIVLPARLLWDKGVAEFVHAATIIRKKGVIARFALVGDIDPDNRASVDRDFLRQLESEGVVEVWGFCSNIASVMAQASIVCLPSYREGLPKALLEGMAAGLPCVTTDVPGCREAVNNGVNGLLVPPQDPEALANALSFLISSPIVRRAMGLKGRERILNEFETKIICHQTLAVYEEVLTL